MKIIFLDFDGVIAPLAIHNSANRGFSITACANLQSILDKESEARIVISSSWRRLGLEECKKILKECNIDSLKVIDVTDGDGGWEPQFREPQIQRWLDAHDDVTNYLVIDDFPLPKFYTNSIKPNGYIGLTQKDTEMAIRILKNENK